MNVRVLAATLLSILWTVGAGEAAPITFDYKVRIDKLDADAIVRYAGVRTAFGAFTFDSNAPDSTPLDGHAGIYSSLGAPYGMTLHIGGDTYSFNDLRIRVFDNATNFPPPGGLCCFDQWDVTEEAIVPGAPRFGISLRSLFSGDPGPFASDALPVVPPNVAMLPVGNYAQDFNPLVVYGFGLVYQRAGGVFGVANGTVTDITAVPEPASMLLVSTGILVLGMKRSNRRVPHKLFRETH